MHGSRWRREETRPVGPARAAQPRRLSPTLPVPPGRGTIECPTKRRLMMGNCAGIDWASDKHDVLIEDRAGEELLGATFAHDQGTASARCATRWSVSRLSWSRSNAPTGCWSTDCWTPG